MKIAEDTVVTLTYSVTNAAGETIDTSGDAPLNYLHGHGQLVPGLEAGLEGCAAGAKLDIQVGADEGYGARDPEAVFEIDRDELPDDIEPEVGMDLAADDPEGHTVPVWITAVTPTSVTLDGNHPFAGMDLRFAVQVVSVRAATETELKHGHAHDPDEPAHD